ncbi:MAG: hypothetical protein ABL857_01235 [Rickettsiales bacterium]|jgi:hypothetical protein
MSEENVTAFKSGVAERPEVAARKKLAASIQTDHTADERVATEDFVKKFSALRANQDADRENSAKLASDSLGHTTLSASQEAGKGQQK